MIAHFVNWKIHILEFSLWKNYELVVELVEFWIKNKSTRSTYRALIRCTWCKVHQRSANNIAYSQSPTNHVLPRNSPMSDSYHKPFFYYLTWSCYRTTRKLELMTSSIQFAASPDLTLSWHDSDRTRLLSYGVLVVSQTVEILSGCTTLLAPCCSLLGRVTVCLALMW